MQRMASCHFQLPLTVFEQLSTEAGLCSVPAEVPWSTASALTVPTTMFGAEQARGTLDLSAPPDLDSRDFWLRTRLPAPLAEAPHRLLFAGLAGIVDVWVAGQHRLRTENMFRAYELARPVMSWSCALPR
jgi:beta-galactosidase/beta-glucuronidase